MPVNQSFGEFVCKKCKGRKNRSEIPLYSTFSETDPKCRHVWVKVVDS
jgi:hypothetical protein